MQALLCVLSMAGIVFTAKYEHKGCFRSDSSLEGLEGTLTEDIILSPKRCLTQCSRLKQHYFVLKESICACLEDETSYRKENISYGCYIPCAGEIDKSCGGSTAVDLYKVSYCDEIIAPINGFVNQTQFKATFWCQSDWYLYGQNITFCNRGVDSWDIPQIPVCLKNSSDSFKELDQNLHQASTLPLKDNNNTNDIENILKDAVKASEQEKYLEDDPFRIELIIDALTTSAEANDSSRMCTGLVVETVNNFFEINDEILQKSKSKPIKVIDVLEKQVSNLQSKDGNFSKILDNVGITAIKINVSSQTNFITFANIVPENWTQSLTGSLRKENIHVFKGKKDNGTSRTLTSVLVPTDIIKLLFGDEIMVPVSFFIYRNSKLFVSSSPTEEELNLTSASRTITSQVIAATVEGYSVSRTNLPNESFVITKFTTDLSMGVDEKIESADCVQWDRKRKSRRDQSWSKEGCHRMPDEDGLTVCACDRLANFAVLFRVKKEAPNTSVPLYYITLVGSIVSCICLILCLVTMTTLKKVRSKQPTQIHMHLCISLLGLYSTFLAGGKTSSDERACAVISALMHFFSLATISWMSAEAINMYFMFVKMARTDFPSFIKISCLLCYGCPAVAAVLVTTLDKLSAYKNVKYCFIQPGPGLYFGFLAEVAFLLALNFVIFSGIFRKMLCRPVMASKHRGKRTEIIARVRHGILVWILFGLSWIFGLLSAIDSNTLVFDYIYCIIIAVQGPMIFLLLCVANPDLRNSIAVLFGKKLTDTSTPSTSWNLTPVV